MPRRLTFLLLVGLAGLSVQTTLAADKSKDVAAKDPNQANAAFELQGEYMGSIVSGPLGGRVGLQVVALGKGRFDGVFYPGGLPSNGWVRPTKIKLAGRRAADGALTLSGKEHIARISIAGLYGKIYGSDGREIGRLKKVRRISPTLGVGPAPGGVVLFDGTSTEHFQRGKMTDDGLLKAGATTAEPVGDFQMHLEFRTPFKPQARGQGRGNSGVYIQERYEVQILDSFGLEGAANECGGLYRQREPDTNLCLPPLAWQTYDIYFTAARWNDEDEKTANARISVFHNGIAVHDDVELTSKTGAGKKEEPTKRPIRLQDHGNPVVFRNIWIVHGRGRYDQTSRGCVTHCYCGCCP